MLLRIPILLFTLSLGGCASLISGATSGIANDLADAILNSEDVDTVREGVPAYLLLIDSFLRSSPDNVDLLLAASQLNGAYSIFTTGERAALLNTKALNYAEHAACLENSKLCAVRSMDLEQFAVVVGQLNTGDVPVAYALGVAWTGWLQSHADDPNALAKLSHIKLLLGRLIELDEGYQYGGPHLYLGGLETVLPAMAGGRPEVGREHFEKAIVLSDGQFLMTKVIYAERYARLVFDQPLHDRLLNEVVAADPVVEGMTLTNRIAQERARELLADSNDYF